MNAAPEQLATAAPDLGPTSTPSGCSSPSCSSTSRRIERRTCSSTRPSCPASGRPLGAGGVTWATGSWSSRAPSRSRRANAGRTRAISSQPSRRQSITRALVHRPSERVYNTRASGTALMSPGTPGAQADRADAPVWAPPRRGRALGLTLAALVLGAAATAGWLWSTVGSRSARLTATASAPAPVADWPLPAAPRPAPPLPETVSPRPAIPPVPATNTGDHTGAVNTASVAKPEPAPPAVATGRRRWRARDWLRSRRRQRTTPAFPHPPPRRRRSQRSPPPPSRLQDLLDNRK